MNLEATDTLTYYKIRPLWGANSLPLFDVSDKHTKEGTTNNVIISLPMVATYADMILNDIPYERLLFKLKAGISNK